LASVFVLLLLADGVREDKKNSTSRGKKGLAVKKKEGLKLAGTVW